MHQRERCELDCYKINGWVTHGIELQRRPCSFATVSPSERLMLCVLLILCGASWLHFEGMELAIKHEHRLGLVLVVMRHREVSFRVVEAEKEEGASADQVFLEGHPRHVGGTECALAREQRVLVRVELLFDVSAEH